MKELEFKVDDDCWIFMGNHQGKMTKGKVIKVLDDLPGYLFHHYVIEIPTYIDPLLEVRDGFSMSDAEDQPIGMWRSK